MLDKVDQAKGTDSKKKTFATFLSQWREAQQEAPPHRCRLNCEYIHVGLMSVGGGGGGGGAGGRGGDIDILTNRSLLSYLPIRGAFEGGQPIQGCI